MSLGDRRIKTYDTRHGVQERQGENAWRSCEGTEITVKSRGYIMSG